MSKASSVVAGATQQYMQRVSQSRTKYRERPARMPHEFIQTVKNRTMYGDDNRRKVCGLLLWVTM